LVIAYRARRVTHCSSASLGLPCSNKSSAAAARSRTPVRLPDPARYFLNRLVPVCADLLKAAVQADEVRPDIDALELLFGVGNLCIGAENNPRYDARRMVELVVAGLRLD
jgi:hypothetical protein